MIKTCSHIYLCTICFLLFSCGDSSVSSSSSRNNIEVKHLGLVNRFQRTFCALNAKHLVCAKEFGIKPIRDREAAEHMKNDLCELTDTKYCHVQQLKYSIPYLVPRADELLSDICESFYDSCVSKKYKPHRLVVTSVLRTEEDVRKLRKRNVNASKKSCHRFGTTFDISWKRFEKIDTPFFNFTRNKAASTTILKQILAQVLRDKQLQKRCYAKYEVKQACFHITSR